MVQVLVGEVAADVRRVGAHRERVVLVAALAQELGEGGEVGPPEYLGRCGA